MTKTTKSPNVRFYNIQNDVFVVRADHSESMVKHCKTVAQAIAYARNQTGKIGKPR